MATATAVAHSHGCVQRGCKANVPCAEQHLQDGDTKVFVMTKRPRCEGHEIKVAGKFARPSCDGMGTFAKRDLGTIVGFEWVPCWFCAGTGDQRQMPKVWRDSPNRNRAAYAASA